MQDDESQVSLRYSAIISWTNFAQIRYVLAESPTSSSARFRDECAEALRRVIRLVEEMKPSDFLTLEALLVVR